MIVRRAGSESDVYGGRFTGHVTLDMLLESPEEHIPDTALVHFDDGAVTFWHSHPGGQVLFLREGQGRVGTADEVVTVRPGDLVYAPANERHWHGAAQGASCTFLASTWGTTAWEDEAPSP
jgi:quercetin dioxygenase-like cupin family protein